MFSTPIGAARLFLGVVITLIILKMVVGFISGSISIWAQLADSTLDLFAAVLTFVTIGISSKPADYEHPFGHGKMEDITAGVQGFLLFGAGGAIILSAVNRILHGEVIQPDAGIVVMLFSMVVSIALSIHLKRVAKKYESASLAANAQNITGDIFSTAGVMVGLTLVRLTGRTIIDPILAILVALLILRMAFKVLWSAIGGLLDARLPKAEEDEIIACIKEHTSQLAGFHEVRTRKSGNQRFIDLHLMLPKNTSVEEAHKMCDHLEQDIESRLPRASVTIHVEPCETTCNGCEVTPCDLRINIGSGR